MNKLAIGITTYNNADNIDNIEKIYNISNIDVYIVDDYSTDQTAELLAERNIPCDIPPQKVGAPGVGRNMILEKAIANNNKFVTFVDGDDEVVLENLQLLAENISSRYHMYYTPMLVRGYNDALVPLGISNYIHSGKFSKRKLLREKYTRLKYELLIGSGGRVYNLSIIKKHNLRYDPDKPGQDMLFNHTFFNKASKVYFNDLTKPFYIYDIQLNSLSNNNDLETLRKRIDLIGQAQQYPFAIISAVEYTDKTYERYTNTDLVKEPVKVEIAKLLSDFSGKKYTYVPKNNYLERNETIPSLTRGINIIAVDTDIEIPDNQLFNIVRTDKIESFDEIAKHLKYTKTIVLDKSIHSVDFDFLLESIDNETPAIQPKYLTPNLKSAQQLEKDLYHGFANTGLFSTYTYVGMIFSTEKLLSYDFSFANHFEFLVKSMFFNCLFPVVVNTSGFIMRLRKYNALYRDSIISSFVQCYYSNSRAKIVPYTKLANKDIVPGSFKGVEPSYKSSNMSYEEHSFIETQLKEFQGFEGGYIINDNREIVEVLTDATEVNFSNMICGKNIKKATNALGNTKLVNIPANYRIPDCLNVRTKDFIMTVDEDSITNDTFTSTSYLNFEQEVSKSGAFADVLKLIDEQDNIVTSVNIPKGKYRLYFDKINRDSLNNFNKVIFTVNL